MDTSHYENIYEEFKQYHSYLVDSVVDYRPIGPRSIRLFTKDGCQYDYSSSNCGIRRVREFSSSRMEDLTDELCRSALSYNLIELMDRKGFSQKTLAEYTGLGKGTIYNYINKKATPSLTALRKIAYALGCTVSELVE